MLSHFRPSTAVTPLVWYNLPWAGWVMKRLISIGTASLLQFKKWRRRALPFVILAKKTIFLTVNPALPTGCPSSVWESYRISWLRNPQMALNIKFHAYRSSGNRFKKINARWKFQWKTLYLISFGGGLSRLRVFGLFFVISWPFFSSYNSGIKKIAQPSSDGRNLESPLPPR